MIIDDNDMDVSIGIHVESVDMGMKFRIGGKPGKGAAILYHLAALPCTGSGHICLSLIKSLWGTTLSANA